MQHLVSHNDTFVMFYFQTEAKPIIGPLAVIWKHYGAWRWIILKISLWSESVVIVLSLSGGLGDASVMCRVHPWCALKSTSSL